MARTYGSYMLQPTKDELRSVNKNLRTERDDLRSKVERLSRELKVKSRQLSEAYLILGKQRVDESLSHNSDLID